MPCPLLLSLAVALVCPSSASATLRPSPDALAASESGVLEASSHIWCKKQTRAGRCTRAFPPQVRRQQPRRGIRGRGGGEKEGCHAAPVLRCSLSVPTTASCLVLASLGRGGEGGMACHRVISCDSQQSCYSRHQPQRGRLCTRAGALSRSTGPVRYMREVSEEGQLRLGLFTLLRSVAGCPSPAAPVTTHI